MLTVSNLTYKIGARTILDNCSVNIMDGWKAGIVGMNGAGKTTLFKLIAGELHPDGGTVSMTARQRLGWVRQDIPETDTPLIDMVLAADAEVTALWKAAETEQDPNKIAEIYQRLSDLDAYAAPARAATLLTGLGFKEHQLQEPFSSFSGGWRMRVALAAALFVEPEVLLLDEPTNHLDLEAIMWLEAYLAAYPHTLLIISHDRDLLNKCIDHVVHVDKQKLTLYTGNYDTFERERAMRLGLQQKMHEKQAAQRAHMQKFVDRFRAGTKATQAQSRLKALQKMDIVDAVIADRAVQFKFPSPDKIASPMISINKADVGYTEGRPVLRRIHENIDRDDRIALLGANGNGKSTLIKLIAGKLGVMKGEIFRSGKLRIGYFSQHQTEELNLDSTPYEEMREIMRKQNPDVKEPVVRAKLGAFGFSKTLADNKIGALSGGEKARLLFAFMSFDAPHLLLLDEPTNHLDIDAREALVQALNDYEGAIVIVSHDPTMVERVADRLWLVKDGTCMDFDGDLEDYRKFTIQSRREERKGEKEKKGGEATLPSVSESSPKGKQKSADAAEKKVMQLEQEKKRLEDMMAAPGFYNGDGKKIAEAQSQYDQVLKDLEFHETEWLTAQEG
ncbi:MAG TPA: ABC-F family ATP-binding cassette domain-containing protein [Patescibacteria group bacterium]|nr:ABC-F family ATP-binding cassette domain-containing protein [Patescibacteria group bacterium]